ncbi:hypothetical protein Pcinc_005288 [Petrolisthes cinctipes]|uniref:HTH CENPB-type domain-containing protein n=1 Tax=Petrolisthes cinctipes TaxID=88211 RepID=A0AAE1GDP6_PETCI|nr:hypothetical protein Pcinc_005288 [Petrolisthes cinctipes]
MIEDDAKTCEIVKLLNVPESSVRNIRKKKDEIKAAIKTTTKYFMGGAGGARRAMHDTTEKNRLHVVTEHYVMKWLARRLRKGASVDGPEIRGRAVAVYQGLCAKHKIQNPAPFIASRGWLHRFKKRCGVKLAYYQGELASADTTAAQEFPQIAKAIMEEGGYTPDQVFNCDETGVYWKKSPKATYAHKNLRQAAGTKMTKDRFSVLLCCNASGDFKMKPVIIYKYAKPHSYRHCDMNNLPNCVWYSNNSGYMTASLSLKWLDELKEIQEANSSESEPDQEESQEEEDQEEMTVKAFWKSFKIKHAVDLFCEAWGQINEATIAHAWAPLLPHLKQAGEAARQELEVVARETADVIRAVPGLSCVS